MNDAAASKCLAEYIAVLGGMQHMALFDGERSPSTDMMRQLANSHLNCLREIMEKNGADFSEYGVPVKGWDEL